MKKRKQVFACTLMFALLTNVCTDVQGSFSGTHDVLSAGQATVGQSTASPSNASPSDAMQSGRRFTAEIPDEVPAWYTRVYDGKKNKIYAFVDRNFQSRWRTYGCLEDEVFPCWYECEKNGELGEDCAPVDTEEEYYELAPYLYESSGPSEEEWLKLYDLLDGVNAQTGEIASGSNAKDMEPDGEEENEAAASDLWEREVVDEYLGRNYDGSSYDVWWMSENLDDWSIEPQYYFYGHILNEKNLKNEWYECDAEGNVKRCLDRGLARQTTAVVLSMSNWWMDAVTRPVTVSCGDTLQLVLRPRTSSSMAGNFQGDQDKYIEVYLSNHTVIATKKLDPWERPSEVSIYLTATQSMNLDALQAKYYYSETNDDDPYDVNTYTSDLALVTISGHNYGYSVYTAAQPSCVGAGILRSQCACGSYTDTAIPALGHVWPSDYVTTADNGTYYKDCTRCKSRLETQSNPYTVSYHGNGSTGGVTATSSYRYGTAGTLAPNGFTRQHYIFGGWNQRADGGGTSYSNGQTVSNLTAAYNGTVHLYAQWIPVTYPISFQSVTEHPDGPSAKEFNRNQTYDARLGELPAVSEIGYTFLGWYDGDTKITGDTVFRPERDAEGYRYTAKWKANEYQISFDSNHKDIGDDTVNGYRREYNTQIGTLPMIAVPGYTFLGWYTQKEEGSRVEGDSWTEPRNVTYYAQWKPISYRLLFHTSGENDTDFIDVTYDKAPGALPKPLAEDFEFLGWYSKAWGTDNPEMIYAAEATPSNAKAMTEDTIYRTATDSNAYAYYQLSYREEDGNRNRRPGKDGVMESEDDKFYFYGIDRIHGTRDDQKVYAGTDGIYGTEDDYYILEDDGSPEEIRQVFPGEDGSWGTEDDFKDNHDGTHTNPGKDLIFGTEDDITVGGDAGESGEGDTGGSGDIGGSGEGDTGGSGDMGGSGNGDADGTGNGEGAQNPGTDGGEASDSDRSEEISDSEAAALENKPEIVEPVKPTESAKSAESTDSEGYRKAAEGGYGESTPPPEDDIPESSVSEMTEDEETKAQVLKPFGEQEAVPQLAIEKPESGKVWYKILYGFLRIYGERVAAVILVLLFIIVLLFKGWNGKEEKQDKTKS